MAKKTPTLADLLAAAAGPANRAGNAAAGTPAPPKGVRRPLTPPTPGTIPGTPGGPAPTAAQDPRATATGLPIDPGLDQIIGGINSARDTTISGLEAQKPQVLANYGYKAAGYDATGAPTGLTFDPNNPYSQAALAKKNYDQQALGTGNRMAAAGQLYSGAYGNAQNIVQSNRQVANDALTKALVAALVGIAGKEQTARDTAENNIAVARGQRMPTT